MEASQSAEIILYDVLYYIFSYLNIYDLNQVAKVCKSWYHAASIERLKRGPQVMILQALEDFVATGFSNVSPINENEIIDDFKVSLRIKPSIGLFFTDGKYPTSADCDSVPYEICVAHQWTQPDDCFYVAVETLGINVDNNIIGGERNITAAVFLPDLPNTNYSIIETSSHSIEQYFRTKNSLLTKLTNKLFKYNTNHTCFIMFIYQWKDQPNYEYYHSNFLNEILNILKTSYTSRSYTLWGGAINDVFTMTTDTRPSYLPTHSTSFCAMSISGSSIKSWSIVLNNNLLDSEIEEKLLNFKKHIHLKASLAFVIIPTNEDVTDRSKIEIFKSIFPTVRLISIFNNKNNIVLSVNSTNNESNPKLMHESSYAFLILTYKL